MADAQITITANTRQAERALGRLNGSLGSISGAAKIAGAAITALATSRILTSIVQTTARFQDLRTSLASVAGGAREGAQAFEFINRFATQTQFGVEELTQTYIKLQAAGITPTEELLTTFTDTAAVTTDQLGSLQAITDLFARTTAGGLGLEELNRLADRGIPVFTILEEKLGRNKNQITELGKTAEGTAVILEALQDGINERFGGATAARINNVSTQFSNLRIAIDSAADAVGSQGFAKALGDTATQITKTITSNKELVQEIGVRLTQAFLIAIDVGKFLIQNIALIGKAFLFLMGIKVAGFLLGVGTAMLGLAKTIGAVLIPAIMAVGKQILNLGKTLLLLIPGGAIVRGIVAGLTLAATYFGFFGGSAEEGTNKATDAFSNMNDVLKSLGVEGLEDLQAGIKNSRAEAEKLAEEANRISENSKTAGDIAKVTADNYQEQADALGQAKKTFAEIVAEAEKNLAVARANNEANETTRALKLAEVELGRELTAQESERLAAINQQTQQQKILNKLKEAEQEYLDDITQRSADLLNEVTGLRVKGEIEALRNIKRVTMAQLDTIADAEGYTAQEIARMKLDIARDTQRKIDQLELQSIETRLQANKRAIAQQLSETDRATLQRIGQEERQQGIVRDRIEFEKKSEAEKAQWAIAQGAEVFNQLGTYNKRAFEAAKALNIANAIMNTYTGATKALATYPPPFNYIAAAAVVAAGLAQVAAIRSQSYSGRALGGPVAGQQSYIVGERGPELFTPNTAGRITRNQDLQGGQPVNINFNIQANDAQGFDDLLLQRKGLITQLVSDAITDRGQRSIV